MNTFSNMVQIWAPEPVMQFYCLAGGMQFLCGFRIAIHGHIRLIAKTLFVEQTFFKKNVAGSRTNLQERISKSCAKKVQGARRSKKRRKDVKRRESLRRAKRKREKIRRGELSVLRAEAKEE